MHQSEFIQILDASAIGETRRLATRAAEILGFDEDKKGKVAIVANELVSNIVKHGGSGGGDFIIDRIERKGRGVLRLYALDRGPGMKNVNLCLQDGYSTSGTVGVGLGAVKRLSQTFDIYSQLGKGTAIFCEFYNADAQDDSRFLAESLNLPYPGEDLSGDSNACDIGRDFATFMVADGLGHGALAFDAAKLARETFLRNSQHELPHILEDIHRALISSRGAAIAISRIHFGKKQLEHIGLGNIAGQILSRSGVQSLMIHDGIAGQVARRFSTVTYPWTDDSTLILHSDGLSSRVRIDATNFPGISLRHPALIAAIFMRDARRGRDDASILVAKARDTWSAL